MITDTVIELEGVNGEFFNLTTGDRGVYLSDDADLVALFYDPPVKVVYEEPGNYPGARYLNHRILKRDIVFPVEILNDGRGSKSWLSRDSEWRKAWAFNRTCKLYVTTPDSGTRYLHLALFQSPTVEMYTDPRGNPINATVMNCVAYDPFWYEDDKVFPVKTKLDTRFKPAAIDLPGQWPWEKMPKEELVISVGRGDGGVNPTDQYIAPKWTVPGSTEQIPGFDLSLLGLNLNIDIPWEKAPFTQFVIPDYSWEDDEYANRRVKTPGLVYGENCTIDTDRRVEQISSESNTPVWARMNGVRFRNMIPPYTEARDFAITATGCAPGQIITLRLPRPWSRCWGLE